MKYSRLLATASLAGCFSLPAIAQAQSSFGGSSNYGIFGGGTMDGAYGGGAFGNSFGRGTGFGQRGFGGGSSFGSMGRQGPLGIGMGNGSGSTLSPYLNLLRPGNAAINYYALVRPQFRQEAINTQYSTNFQQIDRLLSEHRLLQETEATPPNVDLLPAPRKIAPESQSNARRQASDTADTELREWANGYGEPNSPNDAKSIKDSTQRRRRTVTARQAQELKALEDELAGSSSSSRDVGQTSQSPSSQPNTMPASTGSGRNPNHYFPTTQQGPKMNTEISRPNNNRSGGNYGGQY
jgi:hypothetical protein